MSFINYKGTADWLARILRGIADRLILNPNERNFLNAFKNMKAAYWQQQFYV